MPLSVVILIGRCCEASPYWLSSASMAFVVAVPLPQTMLAPMLPAGAPVDRLGVENVRPYLRLGAWDTLPQSRPFSSAAVVLTEYRSKFTLTMVRSHLFSWRRNSRT